MAGLPRSKSPSRSEFALQVTPILFSWGCILSLSYQLMMLKIC